MSKQQFEPLRLLLFSLLTVEAAKYSSRYKQSDYLSTTTTSTTTRKTDENNSDWPLSVLSCIEEINAEKCMKIFLVKRTDRVLNVLNVNGKNDVSIDFNVIDEFKRDFQWENYKTMNDDDIDNRLSKNIKDIFGGKRTTLVLQPGIVDVDIISDVNETILNFRKDANVDVSRGMKFSKKTFYKIVPFLLIPPLIMSAILPFVLPAMKMMILGAGLLNQMALVGAVFTLMRNNAFQDSYTKKVVYVNDGWKNEKKKDFHRESNVHKFSKPPQFPHLVSVFNENIGVDDDDDFSYINHNFINQYSQPHIPINRDEFDRSGIFHKKNDKIKKYG